MSLKERWVEAQQIADQIPSTTKNEVFQHYVNHKDQWLKALEGDSEALNCFEFLIQNHRKNNPSIEDAAIQIKQNLGLSRSEQEIIDCIKKYHIVDYTEIVRGSKFHTDNFLKNLTNNRSQTKKAPIRKQNLKTPLEQVKLMMWVIEKLGGIEPATRIFNATKELYENL